MTLESYAREHAVALYHPLYYDGKVGRGALSYLCTLVPNELARHLGRRLHLSLVIAITTVVAMTALLLPLRAATIGNAWSDAIDRTTINAVPFDTNVGVAWQAQALAAVLLLLSAFGPASWKQAAAAISSGLLLATQPITGHAAMNEGWIGTAHQWNDIAHLWSGGAWVGALVHVLLLLPLISDPEFGSQARVALMRFSTVGHLAVASAPPVQNCRALAADSTRLVGIM